MQTKNIAQIIPSSAANWQYKVINRLCKLVQEWRDSGHEPDTTGVLSSGEYAAICLCVGHPVSLADPVKEFLMLDGWLQRWVLEQLGMEAHIGQVIGEDELALRAEV